MLASKLAGWAKAHWPLIVCVCASLAISIAYLTTTLRDAGTLGFPLDDAYIYLTYAKQIGRLEPMTYYPGGPYSAGATSPLWPFLLAPLWAIGLRGYLFVFAAFAVSSVMVAAATALAYRVVERVCDRRFAVIAAVGTAMSGSFTYASLSAMEVGLAAALLFWVVLKLIDENDRESPSRGLLVLLALTSLTRPELTLLIGGLVFLRAIESLFRRRPRLAARWLLPILLPLVWVSTNKLIAGNFFPNTGVAKSHFYLPGFNFSYYFEILPKLYGQMFRGLFWRDVTPLWSGKLTLLFSALAAVALVVWAKRNKQWWAALILAGAPISLLLAVIASSGAWSFHNYRYISASFPWLAALVAIGAALPTLWLKERPAWKWPLFVYPLVVAAAVGWLSWPDLYANVRYFAQGVRDTNDQVVKIGRHINENLPDDARIAFHDAGAISYYGDKPGIDILGLVTNGNARHANAGGGTRFENLEHIPEDQRPTHFAYYPGWLGTHELYGEVVLRTPLRREVWKDKRKRRLIGGGNMLLMKAKWDALGTGHRPCAPTDGWVIVDTVDVADRRSEAKHRYRNQLGPRRHGHPTARWSDIRTGDCGELKHITDGGRVHRQVGGEHFVVRLDPGRDARLVIRTGGEDNRVSKTDKAGANIEVSVDGKVVGRFQAQGTRPGFTDAIVDIPSTFLGAEEVTLRLDAVPFAPYRTFHHFVLQPPQ